MNPLDFIPKGALVALAVAFAATSCKFKADKDGMSIEIEKGKTHVAQLQTVLAQSNAQAQEQSAIAERKARTALEDAARRERALAADARAARSELDGLRTAASTYALRPSASAVPIAPSLDYPNPFPELFLQCAERYIDLAAKADGHASDAKTLSDAWPGAK